MAKRKRLHSSRSSHLRVVSPRRETFAFAKPPRLPRLLPLLVQHSGEDRRFYAPSKLNRVYRSLSGVTVAPRPRFWRDYINARQAFRPRNVAYSASPSRRSSVRDLDVRLFLPPDAVVCARRKIRRSVIFARGRGGTRVRKSVSRSQILCPR